MDRSGWARRAFVAVLIGGLALVSNGCVPPTAPVPAALSCGQVVANLTRPDLTRTYSLGTAQRVGCIDSTAVGVTGFTFETLNVGSGTGCGANTTNGYAVVRWSDGTTSEMLIVPTGSDGGRGLQFLPYNGHFTGYEAITTGLISASDCTATSLQAIFAAGPLVFRQTSVTP